MFVFLLCSGFLGFKYYKLRNEYLSGNIENSLINLKYDQALLSSNKNKRIYESKINIDSGFSEFNFSGLKILLPIKNPSYHALPIFDLKSTNSLFGFYILNANGLNLIEIRLLGPVQFESKIIHHKLFNFDYADRLLFLNSNNQRFENIFTKDLASLPLNPSKIILNLITLNDRINFFNSMPLDFGVDFIQDKKILFAVYDNENKNFSRELNLIKLDNQFYAFEIVYDLLEEETVRLKNKILQSLGSVSYQKDIDKKYYKKFQELYNSDVTYSLKLINLYASMVNRNFDNEAEYIKEFIKLSNKYNLPSWYLKNIALFNLKKYSKTFMAKTIPNEEKLSLIIKKEIEAIKEAAKLITQDNVLDAAAAQISNRDLETEHMDDLGQKVNFTKIKNRIYID